MSPPHALCKLLLRTVVKLCTLGVLSAASVCLCGVCSPWSACEVIVVPYVVGAVTVMHVLLFVLHVCLL